MLETADESPRLTIVFLPAMLCDDELYRPQIEGLRDLVEPVSLTVAEPSMAEAANAVLRQAPSRFLLAGTHEAVVRPTLAEFGLPAAWDTALPLALVAVALFASLAL